jgi:transglutaminase-like putative cysteine protease
MLVKEALLSSLTIRHVTTYRYRQPVAFGEHRMMLRPRDSHDQKVVEAHLGISPQPSSLHFTRDDFGNHVAIARFDSRATELRFESVVSLEHSPDTAALDPEHDGHGFPVDYHGDEMPGLAACLKRRHPDQGDEVERWARQFLRTGESIGALELLVRLTEGIHGGFRYRRREARGIQQPIETLRLGHGSCRDFALLMIEAARSLGLAARFASGYLALPFDADEEPAPGGTVDHAHGATHAWAQIYLPASGWIDCDPTSGSIGKAALVTVAVVSDPQDALPLHGTFMGSASDPLGMEVRVSVTSASPPSLGEGSATGS